MKKTVGVVFGIGLVAGAYLAGPSLLMLLQRVFPRILYGMTFWYHVDGSSRWLTIASVALAWRTLSLRPRFPEGVTHPLLNTLIRAVLLIAGSLALAMIALLGLVASDPLLWFDGEFFPVYFSHVGLWTHVLVPINILTAQLGFVLNIVHGNIGPHATGPAMDQSTGMWLLSILIGLLNCVAVCWFIWRLMRKISTRMRLPQDDTSTSSLRKAQIALFALLALVFYVVSSPFSLLDSLSSLADLSDISWIAVHDVIWIVIAFGFAWLYFKGIGRYLAGYVANSDGPLNTEDATASWPPAPKP
jgi:hypothetical protein